MDPILSHTRDRKVNQEIQPHRVTKPIQLLAAWLLGLIAVDGAFLTAARLIVTPPWAPGVLVIAAVVSVPLFLICIFILQTRFRPQMQEDSYYSRYLALQQQTLKKVGSPPDQILRLHERVVSSQNAVNDAISVLDDGMAEIRAQLAGALPLPSERAEAFVETSERIIANARSRLLPRQIDVEVNDLLPMYEQLRETWLDSRIKVKDTFGSSSEERGPAQYAVVIFGDSLTGDAMHEVCQSLINTGEWYVGIASEWYNVGKIYIGSYGYGGKAVTRLNTPLLHEMSRPDFSTGRLIQWISSNPVRLDADYPTKRND